jgi:hypothetical protein
LTAAAQGRGGLEGVYIWLAWSCLDQDDGDLRARQVQALPIWLEAATHFVALATGPLDAHWQSPWCRLEAAAWTRRGGVEVSWLLQLGAPATPLPNPPAAAAPPEPAGALAAVAESLRLAGLAPAVLAAAAAGDAAALAAALAAEGLAAADLALCDAGGQTCYHHACAAGCAVDIGRLLAAGCGTAVEDATGRTGWDRPGPPTLTIRVKRP